MRFYLGRFLGGGTLENPFMVAADDYAIIDLRGDSTNQAGRVVVATPTALSSTPAGWRDLGDDLDSKSATRRTRLGNDLSLTLGEDTLRGAIAELLLVHGRPPHDKSRWNPLQATEEGRHRIVVANETIFDAPAIVGTILSDNFNRANETPLVAPWTKAYGATGTVNLAGNALASTATETAFYRYDGGDLASDNHYAEIISQDITNATDYFGPIVRFSALAHTLYLGSVRETATATARILKYVATALTVIATSNQTAAAAPYTTRLEANGSTLTLTGTDHTTISTTDTDITGNLRVGFAARNSAVSQNGDAWSAADLATIVTPATIAVVTSLPTPAIPTAATVTPTVIAAAAALPTPIILAAAKVIPAVIPLTALLPTPTIDVISGPATVTPAVIAAIAALPTPIVSIDAVVTPAGIAIVVTVPNPGVTIPGLVTPATIPIIVALPSAGVTAGAITFWSKDPVGYVKIGAGDQPPWN